MGPIRVAPWRWGCDGAVSAPLRQRTLHYLGRADATFINHPATLTGAQEPTSPAENVANAKYRRVMSELPSEDARIEP